MFRRPHGRPQSRYGGMPRRRRIIRTRYSSTEETARQEPAPPGGRIAHAPSLRPLAGRSRLVDTGRTPGPPRTRDAGRVARPYVVAERGSTRARHPPVTRSPTPGKARRSRSARPSRAGSLIHRTCTASVTCCIGKTPSASGPSRLNPHDHPAQSSHRREHPHASTRHPRSKRPPACPPSTFAPGHRPAPMRSLPSKRKGESRPSARRSKRLV